MYDTRLKNSVENVEWSTTEEPIDTAAFYTLAKELKATDRATGIVEALARYAKAALQDAPQNAFVKFELNDGAKEKIGILAVEFNTRYRGGAPLAGTAIELEPGTLAEASVWILRHHDRAMELSKTLQAWIAEQAKLHARRNEHAAQFSRSSGVRI